jgi:hypothetical protein
MHSTRQFVLALLHELPARERLRGAEEQIDAAANDAFDDDDAFALGFVLAQLALSGDRALHEEVTRPAGGVPLQAAAALVLGASAHMRHRPCGRQSAELWMMACSVFVASEKTGRAAALVLRHVRARLDSTMQPLFDAAVGSLALMFASPAATGLLADEAGGWARAAFGVTTAVRGEGTALDLVLSRPPGSSGCARWFVERGAPSDDELHELLRRELRARFRELPPEHFESAMAGVEQLLLGPAPQAGARPKGALVAAAKRPQRFFQEILLRHTLGWLEVLRRCCSSSDFLDSGGGALEFVDSATSAALRRSEFAGSWRAITATDALRACERAVAGVPENTCAEWARCALRLACALEALRDAKGVPPLVRPLQTLGGGDRDAAAAPLAEAHLDERVRMQAALRSALTLQIRWVLDAAVRADVMRRRHALFVVQFMTPQGPRLVARSLCRLLAVVAEHQTVGRVEAKRFVALSAEDLARQEEALGIDAVQIGAVDAARALHRAVAQSTLKAFEQAGAEFGYSTHPTYVESDRERFVMSAHMDGCRKRLTPAVDEESEVLQTLLRARLAHARKLHEVLYVSTPAQYASSVELVCWPPTPNEADLFTKKVQGGVLAVAE